MTNLNNIMILDKERFQEILYKSPSVLMVFDMVIVKGHHSFVLWKDRYDTPGLEYDLSHLPIWLEERKNLIKTLQDKRNYEKSQDTIDYP